MDSFRTVQRVGNRSTLHRKKKKKDANNNSFSQAGATLTFSFAMVKRSDLPMDLASADTFVVPLASVSLSGTQSWVDFLHLVA